LNSPPSKSGEPGEADPADEEEGGHDRQRGHPDDRRPVRQRPGQPARVAVGHPLEPVVEALGDALDEVPLPRRVGGQVPVGAAVVEVDLGVVPDAREHRVEREAHEQRHDHRRRHGHAELEEDLADLPAHERHRDEHGDHGHGGGEHRQPDLVGPSLAACSWSFPISRWRTMFSRTTMASSISSPIASDRASRVIVLMVKPQIHMAKNADMIEIGSASPVMTVERQEFRKK
jgi:hypothetical protein